MERWVDLAFERACAKFARGAKIAAQQGVIPYMGAKDKYLPSSTNTVMVHILNLRKKLEVDHTDPKLIRTGWGKGYQLDEG